MYQKVNRSWISWKQCSRDTLCKYLDKPIEEEKLAALNKLIDECNKEGGLHIQLINEEKAFGGLMAKMSGFSGVKYYLAMIGKNGDDLAEKLGYYGEKIVLEAQMMGLNTHWVAGSFKKVKSAYDIADGEKVLYGISIGYGADQGKTHKIKTVADVTEGENLPDWFVRGAEAALLAPTAMNMQNFLFTLEGSNGVRAQKDGGMYGDVDVGIAKYHFEVGAGKENFTWVK